MHGCLCHGTVVYIAVSVERRLYFAMSRMVGMVVDAVVCRQALYYVFGVLRLVEIRANGFISWRNEIIWKLAPLASKVCFEVSVTGSGLFAGNRFTCGVSCFHLRILPLFFLRVPLVFQCEAVLEV